MSYLDNAGLRYFWNKIKSTFVRMSVATITLNANSWTLSSGYYIQSVTVSGVTANNKVLVECSAEAYSQTTNSLSFRTEILPTSNITAKIYIFT